MIPNVISVSQIHFYNIVLHASGTVSEASMVTSHSLGGPSAFTSFINE